MTIALDAIRDCFEGTVPGIVATCAADGTPNVSYVSHVHYVDRTHVALSYQFFSKTRQNIAQTPTVRLQVVHPQTAATFELEALYLRTETDGPLFRQMHARLACIAAETGMSDVFRLRGADVYRVERVSLALGDPAVPLPPRSALAAARAIAETLSRSAGLGAQIEALLDGLVAHLDVPHAMVLLADSCTGRLVVVSSRGYRTSGAGAEVGLGEGVAGIAAQARTPIRLTHVAHERAYVAPTGAADPRSVPYVGLAAPTSQLAVPILSEGELRGVLLVESSGARRFGHDDEDALTVLATQFGAALSGPPPAETAATEETTPDPPHGSPSTASVRCYEEDDSVFVDGDYLIKGVAGAILWAMLSDHAATGKTEFSNRELRLDPRLRLRGAVDNLEARLLLLTRRLADRVPWLRLERVSRGRLRLLADRPIALERVGSWG